MRLVNDEYFLAPEDLGLIAEHNFPPSLKRIACSTILRSKRLLHHIFEDKNGLCLPSELVQRLLNILIGVVCRNTPCAPDRDETDIFDSINKRPSSSPVRYEAQRSLYLYILKKLIFNVGKIPVSHLRLFNLKNDLTVQELAPVIRSKLRRLEIQNCEIPTGLITILKENLEDLEELVMINSCHKDWSNEEDQVLTKAPNLKYLRMGRISYRYILDIPPGLEHLEILDASRIPLSPNQVKKCTNLVSLSLCNVMGYQKLFPVIPLLKNLTHLEISQISKSHLLEGHGRHKDVFDNPQEELRRIVEALPNLTSLDISGTCMIRPLNAGECALAGLESRINKPLEFLGIFLDQRSAPAVRMDKIPAKEVAGNWPLETLIKAGVHYLKRKDVIFCVITMLKDVAVDRDEDGPMNNHERLLESMDLAIRVLFQYAADPEIAHETLLLFNEVNYEERQTPLTHNQIILEVLLNVARNNLDSTRVLRRCINNLETCYRKLYEVRAFWEELLDLLCSILKLYSDSFREVDFGTIGFISDLISRYDEFSIAGEKKIVSKVMEAFVLVLQDSMRSYGPDPKHCKVWCAIEQLFSKFKRSAPIEFNNFQGPKLIYRFMEKCPASIHHSSDYFHILDCIEQQDEIMKRLFCADFVEWLLVLIDKAADQSLWDTCNQGAGILAKKIIEGPEAWNMDVDRDYVLQRFRINLFRWPIKHLREIDYSKIEVAPLLKLLDSSEPPEIQLWAAWILANGCKTNVFIIAPRMINYNGYNQIKQFRWYWDLKKTNLSRCESNEKGNPQVDPFEKEVLKTDNNSSGHAQTAGPKSSKEDDTSSNFKGSPDAALVDKMLSLCSDMLAGMDRIKGCKVS